jgi:hypothetical protein
MDWRSSGISSPTQWRRHEAHVMLVASTARGSRFQRFWVPVIKLRYRLKTNGQFKLQCSHATAVSLRATRQATRTRCSFS